MMNIALSLAERDGGFLNVVTVFFRHWVLYLENDSFVLSCLFFKNIVREPATNYFRRLNYITRCELTGGPGGSEYPSSP